MPKASRVLDSYENAKSEDVLDMHGMLETHIHHLIAVHVRRNLDLQGKVFIFGIRRATLLRWQSRPHHPATAVPPVPAAAVTRRFAP